MRKFDTKVQHLKYKVLRTVAKHYWNGQLTDNLLDIPLQIVPGKKPSMRCCVYKERAIIGEMVKLAMGGDKNDKNVIEVIDIACDECPASGYEVTEACRGCMAHRCEDVCRKGCITFDEDMHAVIDKSKCINCGACAQVCPFSAIINKKRPCEKACKIHAISMAEDGEALIDDSKCIACGACVYQCPFGAISDKSYILDVIDLIKGSDGGRAYKLYAVVAPAISSQFTYARLGQVISGIKELGFHEVVEAALGADMVAWAESAELCEKGFLTSSCCPAFVDYVGKYFPQMKDNISHNLSPMATISKYIKEKNPDARVVFIGPCTAKKAEILKPEVSPYVDSAITFEELQALFDSRGIEISELTDTALDNASYFGRIFARCGGLADAVAQGLKEHDAEFELAAVSCDGIDECRTALLKAAKHADGTNFIEGMACKGGCACGAGCLTHAERNRIQVEKFGRESADQTISSALSHIDRSVE